MLWLMQTLVPCIAYPPIPLYRKFPPTNQMRCVPPFASDEAAMTLSPIDPGNLPCVVASPASLATKAMHSGAYTEQRRCTIL